MEPENLNEEPIEYPQRQNQRSWWYYPISWFIQFVVFTIALAVFGAGLALITLALIDSLGFTQQYNLFIALIVYALVVAGSVWLGLKLDKKYYFYYFISANLLAAVAAVLLLIFASVFSLYGSDRESYGEQSSLRVAQMNLRAAAELHYEQNNRSYEGFCQSEYVEEVRAKADFLTAQSKSNNHLLDCVATRESYAVEIPYFEPMQDSYLCVSANAEPVASSTSVISDEGLCGAKSDTDEEMPGNVVIDSVTFTWNGQTGVVSHECVRENESNDLLYYGPPPFDERRERVYCNQKNILRIELDENNTVIEEFSVSTTSDYKTIKTLGFTTDQFGNDRNREFLVGATTSNTLSEKLLLGFYHDVRCEWNDGVCPTGQRVTHYISIPDLTIYTEPILGALAGRGALKWNNDRTAFVMRSYGDDIQPSFFLCVLGQQECERYDDVTLSYDRSEWTSEQRDFAERMWNEEEIEWLSENEVKIFDDTISLEDVEESPLTAEFKDEELGISFNYPAAWGFEKAEICGYRILSKAEDVGMFLSAFSREGQQGCRARFTPSWYPVAANVTSEYLNQCETRSNCEVIMSDHGVPITRDITYLAEYYDFDMCGENGEVIGVPYGVDRDDVNCKINAIYRVYKDSGDFNGFVLNTAPINPSSDERETIMEKFEESVIKTFRFTE